MEGNGIYINGIPQGLPGAEVRGLMSGENGGWTGRNTEFANVLIC
jgi:hypothetical protein